MAGTREADVRLPVYHAPRVPRAPRPHRDGAIWAGLVLVGTLSTAAIASSINTVNNLQPRIEPIPVRPNPPDPEIMKYPYGEQNLRLVLDSSGIIVPEYTTTPQILEANNTLVHYFVPKLGEKYDNMLKGWEVGYGGDVTVIVGKDNPDVLEGGIWLEASDAEGNPVSSDGSPLREGESPVRYMLNSVEFIQIPPQEVNPVLASVS